MFIGRFDWTRPSVCESFLVRFHFILSRRSLLSSNSFSRIVLIKWLTTIVLQFNTFSDQCKNVHIHYQCVLSDRTISCSIINERKQSVNRFSLIIALHHYSIDVGNVSIETSIESSTSTPELNLLLVSNVICLFLFFQLVVVLFIIELFQSYL